MEPKADGNIIGELTCLHCLYYNKVCTHTNTHRFAALSSKCSSLLNLQLICSANICLETKDRDAHHLSSHKQTHKTPFFYKGKH